MKKVMNQKRGMLLKRGTNDSVIMQLEQGEITLGRAEDNSVVIDNKTVSAHHARIFTYFSVSYIEDTGSTNGTFLNGKRIKKHILNPGDVIQLGEFRLNLEANPQEPAQGNTTPHQAINTQKFAF